MTSKMSEFTKLSVEWIESNIAVTFFSKILTCAAVMNRISTLDLSLVIKTFFSKLLTYHCLKGANNWSKYTILTTHLYTCVIIIDITFFYIYFNEKHCILIYYCLLIFSFQFFNIINVISLLLLL